MASGPARRLTRFAQRVGDGDLAGAVFEAARTALLAKVGLPALAAAAALLLVLLTVVAAVSGAKSVAAQACGQGLSSDAPLNTSGAGPVGAPAPSADIPLFQAAAVQYGLGSQGPSILAAINEVETTFDTSSSPGVHAGANSAGAEGAMQFEPGTWAQYGAVAPGGADPASPYDERDAVWSAANYLHASGAPGNWQAAIFTYNHAGWYVDEVLADAATMYASGSLAGSGGSSTPVSVALDTTVEQCASAVSVPLSLTPGETAQILPGGTAAAPADAPPAVKRAIAAGNALIDKPYRRGGGHGQSLETLANSYDCSSATSYVLFHAGLFGAWPEVSGQLTDFGEAGTGTWISVYANSGHAFVEVAGIVLDTAWYSKVQPTTPNSGPRWQPASIIPAQYSGDVYGGFVARHPPGL